MPEPVAPGLDPTGLVVLVVTVLAGTGYLVALRRQTGRRSWPRRRTLSWLAGSAAVLVGSLGPLAAAADTDFRAHAAAHLLVGMLGPLLLVGGAPLSLALRALPVSLARGLTARLRHPALRVLSDPVVAGLLDVGGLWLLYRTPLSELSHLHPGVHLLVHLHLVLAGYLFAAVLVGRDPLPHRRPYRYRAVVLVAALAAHAILAKLIYAHPPVGVDPGTAEAGAMVMYYGGDAVELALAVLLCRRWFRLRRVPSPDARTPVAPSGPPASVLGR